jgi:hypothetical protein
MIQHFGKAALRRFFKGVVFDVVYLKRRGRNSN